MRLISLGNDGIGLVVAVCRAATQTSWLNALKSKV
jgi:hypothetical protein